MSPRRLLLGGTALAVLVLLVVGLLQLGGNAATPEPSRLTPAQMQARLAGSPAPLAELHAQADELLGGGLSALRARLSALRGRPTVINRWASWCEPCRSEFGVFQAVSVARGREVAFLGIDSGDPSRGKPEQFLRSFPVSYPSYFDPSEQAGEAITESGFTPVTVFINRRGGEYVRQGPYPTVAKLEADIGRYALDG
jgi:cytochrome c biogenesis protein CcmG, thiol:disulfide interchange protein DsbE